MVKLSNKILLGGFIAVVALFLGIIVVVAVKAPAKDRVVTERGDFGTFSILEENSEEFSSFNLEGAWDIRVRKGSDYKVTFRGSENYLNSITAYAKDDVLWLKNPGAINAEDIGFSIIVETPQFSGVESKGVANVEVEGINSPTFVVSADGIINLITDNSKYDSVKLYLEGIGNVELNDSDISDLYIDSSLLGSIKVDVKEAVIDGLVEGMGEVSIWGSIKNNWLESDGLVEITTN